MSEFRKNLAKKFAKRKYKRLLQPLKTKYKNEKIEIFLENLVKKFQVSFCEIVEFSKKTKNWEVVGEGFFIKIFNKWNKISGRGISKKIKNFNINFLEIETKNETETKEIFKKYFLPEREKK